MRRSIFAGIGVAAVLVLAACTPDQPASRDPLAPTDPVLAQGDQCAGGLASQIAKEQKALYSGTVLTAMQNQFTVLKNLCPGDSTTTALHVYLQMVVNNRGANPDSTRAANMVKHVSSVTNYFTSVPVNRSYKVFMSNGGADVLTATVTNGDSMFTFDKGARLRIQANTYPNKSHFFTFESRPMSDCDATTSLRTEGPSGANLRGTGSTCYDIKDYPHETSYSPKMQLTICMLDHFGETGIVHQIGAGGEVLPDLVLGSTFCDDFQHASNSWLKQNGGPFGRVLASAYDYLRPRSLLADDVGESGSIGLFSLVGGALNVVFEDNFGEIGTPPDIGDAWQIDTTFPGYIRVESSFGLLTDSVVVLSQAQGNCANCPPFQLIGTRVNASQVETLGSYQVTWTSLQNKPSVKEAPFVLLNENNEEIARLSYVSLQNQGNRLLFTVNQPGTDSVYDVGAWVRDQPQNFKITVNQTVLGSNDNSVSFGFGTNPTDLPLVGPVQTNFASKLVKIGYVLTGIDAGVIASNKWVVIRLSDTP